MLYLLKTLIKTGVFYGLFTGNNPEEGSGPCGGVVQYAEEQPTVSVGPQIAGLDDQQRDVDRLQLVHRTTGGQRTRQRKRSVD